MGESEKDGQASLSLWPILLRAHRPSTMRSSPARVELPHGCAWVCQSCDRYHLRRNVMEEFSSYNEDLCLHRTFVIDDAPPRRAVRIRYPRNKVAQQGLA
jgi:hypothetical protein